MANRSFELRPRPRARSKLLPDELVVELMIDVLKGLEAEGGARANWLLDGFPRTVDQAKVLDQATKANMVLNIDVPDDEICERIQHRWVHVESGRVYHMLFSPPKDGANDDETGEPLVQRDDDKLETVLARLETYHNSTKPILQHYGEMGLTRAFAGTESNVIYPVMQAYVEGTVRGQGGTCDLQWSPPAK